MDYRPLFIVADVSRKYIFAADHSGTICKLSLSLEVLARSPRTLNVRGIKVIKSDDKAVYGRDEVGNLLKWNRFTLQPEHFLVSEHFCDPQQLYEGQTPMPAPSNGLFLWKDKVVVTNAYGQLVFFDKQNMEMERVINPSNRGFVETICTEGPNYDVLVDGTGCVFFGDLEQGVFSRQFYIDRGNVHTLRWDNKHKRYWATTDNHRGFIIFSDDKKIELRVEMTVDDTEWMDCNDDQSLVYFACFDHFLYIFSNEDRKPKQIGKIGPFKMQLSQVLWVDDEHLYVLLESGEIYHLDSTGEVCNQVFGTNAIWGLDALPSDDKTLYCAMEDGTVAIVKIEPKDRSIDVRLEERSPNFGFGRIRRALPLPDQSFLGISTSGMIFRSSIDGKKMHWFHQMLGIGRDISVFNDFSRAIFSSEGKQVFEVNVESGEIIWRQNFKEPVWTLSYTNEDQIVIGERTRASINDDLTSKDIDSCLRVFSIGREEIAQIPTAGNPKRLRILPNGNLLLNGNGDIGISEIDTKTWKRLKTWKQWQINTFENAVQVGDRIHGITYGHQIITYDLNDEKNVLDVQFTVEDVPKALASIKANNRVFIVAGGRGPFLSVYEVTSPSPVLVRTLYL